MPKVNIDNDNNVREERYVKGTNCIVSSPYQEAVIEKLSEKKQQICESNVI